MIPKILFYVMSLTFLNADFGIILHLNQHVHAANDKNNYFYSKAYDSIRF